MSIFTKVWDWLKKAFTTVETSADTIAISVTEVIKSALNSGALGFIAEVVDSLTKSGVAEEVVALLQKYIPEVLAAELALQGLPANPTSADILVFEQAILAAFNVNSNTSKLYTVLAAQIYGDIQTTINNTPGKFADWVATVEEAYQQYLSDNNATS